MPTRYTIATVEGSQTLTNKTLTSPVINTPTGDVVTPTGSTTLTNKTLTSPVINTGVSGTALITSTILSGANNTTIPSSLAAKTYVDTVANRWQALASTLRVSDATFTSTTDLSKGTVIKFIIGGVSYYAQIIDKTGSGTYTYTISGAAISSNPTSISYDSTDNSEMIEWFWSGTYADAVYARLINTKTAKPATIGLRWDKAKAYLVGVSVANVTTDTGATTQPKITVTHAGDAVTSAIEVKTTVSNGGADFTSKYDINYGESIDLSVTQANGGTPSHAAAGLWIQLIYVKE